MDRFRSRKPIYWQKVLYEMRPFRNQNVFKLYSKDAPRLRNKYATALPVNYIQPTSAVIAQIVRPKCHKTIMSIQTPGYVQQTHLYDRRTIKLFFKCVGWMRQYYQNVIELTAEAWHTEASCTIRSNHINELNLTVKDAAQWCRKAGTSKTYQFSACDEGKL